MSESRAEQYLKAAMTEETETNLPAPRSRVERLLKNMADNGVAGGSGGANADWSVNDPDAPGYVKNRTHWKETAFEPIVVDRWDDVTSSADMVDATALELGIFYKISDQILTSEELNGAMVSGSDFTYGYSGEGFMVTSEMYGFTCASCSVVSYAEGYDIIGLLCVVFPSAMEIPEFGLRIPSGGIYVLDVIPPLVSFIISKTTIHQLDEKFVQEKTIPSMSFISLLDVLPIDGNEYSVKASDYYTNIFQTSNSVRVRLFVSEYGDKTFFLHPMRAYYDGDAFVADAVDVNSRMILTVTLKGGYFHFKATPFTPESYQTAKQVQAMIDEAIAKLKSEL